MIDYISREEAILALLKKGQHSKRYKIGETWELNFDEIREAIKAIPNADVVPRKNYESMERTVDKLNKALAERKHGKWNWVGFNIECSECGAMPNFDSTEPLYNFCPNCGARMESEGEA